MKELLGGCIAFGVSCTFVLIIAVAYYFFWYVGLIRYIKRKAR